MAEDVNNGGKTYVDETGRFAPGNPGRPRGARNQRTKAIEVILDGDAEKLTRKAVELALAGDTTCLRMCLERILPVARTRPVDLPLPELKNATDVLAAASAIVQAASSGEIDLEQAQGLSALIESQRKGIEIVDFEERIRALEAKLPK